MRIFLVLCVILVDFSCSVAMRSDEVNEVPKDKDEKIRFHHRFGNNVNITIDGITAYRLDTNDCCDAGVITHRALKPNELFQVRLDIMEKVRFGSLNIGVTTHHPDSIEFRRHMVGTSSGMWMFWGRRILINGEEVTNEYGSDIEKLKAGDMVGVLKTENGDLHLYINGVDQGVAAEGLPSTVYGVADVRSNTHQVSINDGNVPDDDRFHLSSAKTDAPVEEGVTIKPTSHMDIVDVTEIQTTHDKNVKEASRVTETNE